MSAKKPDPATPEGHPPAPGARRISQPRPKRSPVPPAPALPDLAGGAELRPATLAPPLEVALESSASASDWPEPESPTSGGKTAPDGKRKRRRRKGKGHLQAPAAPAAAEESPPHDDAPDDAPAAVASLPLETPAAPERPRGPQPPPRQHVSRAKVDPETLCRKAWKIYLAEVSEEGVALIGDQDARELARRCFRLAEIFIEEQARRLAGNG